MHLWLVVAVRKDPSTQYPLEVLFHKYICAATQTSAVMIASKGEEIDPATTGYHVTAVSVNT